MTLSLTKENKNTLTLSNEAKDASMTWDESTPLTWDDGSGNWSNPKRPFNKESKNTLTLTNESKI